MVKLTEKEKSSLEMRLKQTLGQSNEHTRICVILGYNDGLTPEELAKAFRLSLATIYNYLKAYTSQEKIKNAPRGGSSSKLSQEQSQALVNHLKEQTYSKVKDICAYVRKTYEITYSRSGMTDWLKDQGFVYKKPKKVPGKLNPQQQEEFIGAYQELKKDLKTNEEIYFIDAVHPAHQCQPVCGWIQKGEEKTLQTTGNQVSLHFSGALCLNGMKTLTEEYETINADNMVDFLRKLESNSSAEKIYVIMDNARANKNKKVEAYLKGSRITIRYLPAYSPNLNPIERLWKLMREKKMYNKYYESSVVFFEEIRKFFKEEVPQLAPSWAARINDHFQSIKLNPIKPAF